MIYTNKQMGTYKNKVRKEHIVVQVHSVSGKTT